MGKIIFGILCICVFYATLGLNLPVTIGEMKHEEQGGGSWNHNLGGHPIVGNTTIPVNHCTPQSCQSACVSSNPGGYLDSVNCQNDKTCVCVWLNGI
ncbi:hypothetical protein ACET3Z_032650 [Daucus carota]